MAQDLTLVLRLLADAQSALKGVQAVNAEVRETGTTARTTEAAAQNLGVVIVNAGQDGSEAIAQLNSKLAAAQTEIDALKTKLGAMPRLPSAPMNDVVNLGRSSEVSAGQMGMMAAQWNDIIMMTMAGQSPLQLAIQQGSQITQSFGERGAAGALKMLAGGFVSMLNPINLGVYAAIAFGSTLVQWLLRSGDEAETADDKLKRLKGTVDELTSTAKAAAEPIDALRRKYGDLADEIHAARMEQLNLQVDLAKNELNAALDGSILNSPFGEADLRSVQDFVAEIDTAKAKIAEARKDADTKGNFYDDTKDQDALNALVNKAQNVTTYIAGLAEQLGTTREQAREILIAVDRVRQAQSDPVKQVEAASELMKLLTALPEADAATKEIIGHLAEAIQRGGDLAAAAGEITRQASGANTAFGEAKATVIDFAAAFDAVVRGANAVVNAQPGTDFLSSAIDRAKALAGWMWSAAGAALSLSQKTPPLRGPAGMGDSSTAFASSHDAKLAADEAAKAHTLATPVPSIAPPSGSSGGGSGRSALQSAVDQGNEIMATLDQSLAAVNEKVSAGLMSTAEGTQAIADAKDRAANALAELIPLLDKLGPQGKVQADTWRAALQDLSAQLKGVQEDTSGLAQVMTEGFKAPFAAFLAGTKSASEAWGDFLSYVNNAIAQKLSDKFTTEMLGPVLDAVFAGFGGMFQFADGGVPGIADLSGQVLTQPTLFGMPGGGLGQAGEAGPEAVMPLKTGPRGLSVTAVMGGREVLLGLTRGKDGKLGVEIPTWSSPALSTPARFAQGGVPGGAPVPATAAGGGSGGGVVVNVTNKAAGAEPRVSERMEGNNRVIDVVIEAVRNGLAEDFATGRGPAAAALQSAFGLSRVGR